MALTEQTRADAVELAGRYPQSRSALLPMLHLVQSAEGTVTPDGIALCADVVGLTTAEVAAVATFYTMYKRHKVGRYHVGVCTNTMCAVLGGDAIWAALSERLGVGHDEVTADGSISLERIECQAACTHAPVVTFDWEFYDDATVEGVRDVIDRLRRGEEVRSTRGPAIRSFVDTERTLAFPDDGLAAEGGGADDKMLAGLRVAQERGMTAPEVPVARSAAATKPGTEA